MTPADRGDWASDEGLALPRTSLAWRRTSLAFLVAALVSFRVALGCTSRVMVVTAAAVVVALAAAVIAMARTSPGSHSIGRPRSDGRGLLATSTLIVLLAVIELTTTMTHCD